MTAAAALDAPPTVEHVLAIVDALETAREQRQWLMRAQPCARCRAAIGEPCRRPSGEPYVETRRYARDLGAPRYHAPRVDRYCDAYASACVIAWRGDLRDGLAPARVLREIRSSTIYRLAVRDGRVRAVPAQTTWPHAEVIA